MRNFKVIEISTKDGKARLVHNNLSEMRAWEKTMDLEAVQARRLNRNYWYVVTNISDWMGIAKDFYRDAKNYV